MKRTYHVYLETNVNGLHSLVHDFEFTGTKTAVITEARRVKKELKSMGKK